MANDTRSSAVRHDGWTSVRRAKFIETLAETGCVAEGARVAGKGKSTAYTLRRRDPEFAEAWDIALECARDDFVSTLRDRALNGVDEPLVYKDKVFGMKRVYSDRLAIYLLALMSKPGASPLIAEREAQRPADDICEKLKEGALRILAARRKPE